MTTTSRTSPQRRPWVKRSVVAATLALAGWAAGPAAASTVSVSGGVLTYAAEPGEANESLIYRAYDPSYSFEIPGAAYVYSWDEVTAGSGCSPAPDVGLIYAEVAYLCRGITQGVTATLGDGDDYLEVDAPGDLPATVDAGAGDDFVGLYNGDDTIDGGAGNDQLYGGPGNDKITGGEGNDELNGDFGGFVDGDSAYEDLESAGVDLLDGGAGDDRLQGNGGADVLIGGAGDDTALYNARKANLTITFNGAADDGADGEKDAIGADVEGVVTGRGDDTVLGSDAAETISTGPGKDSVDPGGGADIVDTGSDVDAIAARDGAADKLACGDGVDSATADAADVVSGDCEQLDQPTKTPAPGGTLSMTAGSLELRSAGRLRAGAPALRMKGRLVLPAGADPRVCLGAAVTVRMSATSKGRRTRRSVTTVLGADCRFSTRSKLRLRPGSRVTVVATLTGTSFLASATSRTMRARVGR